MISSVEALVLLKQNRHYLANERMEQIIQSKVYLGKTQSF